MSRFIESFLKYKETSDFLAEGVKLAVVNEIYELMDENGVTKAELARRLGKSPSYVSRVLGATENLSIESMSKFFHALESNFTVSAIDKRMDPVEYNKIGRGLRRDFSISAYPNKQKRSVDYAELAHVAFVDFNNFSEGISCI